MQQETHPPDTEIMYWHLLVTKGLRPSAAALPCKYWAFMRRCMNAVQKKHKIKKKTEDLFVPSLSPEPPSLMYLQYMDTPIYSQLKRLL